MHCLLAGIVGCSGLVVVTLVIRFVLLDANWLLVQNRDIAKWFVTECLNVEAKMATEFPQSSNLMLKVAKVKDKNILDSIS